MLIKKPGKKRYSLLFAASVLSTALLFSCVLDNSEEENYGIVEHPNTNYYLSEDIRSKTGISNVTISNITSSSSFPMSFNFKISK
jgi:hypothetical protein